MAKNTGMVVLLGLLLIFAGIIQINDSVSSTQCNDGIDNDGDNQTDQDDPYCLYFDIPPPPTNPIGSTDVYYCPHGDDETNRTFNSSDGCTYLRTE